MMELSGHSPMNSSSVSSDPFQRRITAMLEGAAIAFMADYLVERDSSVRASVLTGLKAEVRASEEARREINTLQQESEQRLAHASEIEITSRRRAKSAKRVVEKYRSVFEEIRDELKAIANRIDSESDALDLEAVIDMIEDVARLEPGE